ncbi:hypothetical protein [Cognatilysobacter terrigena]|uniref:ORC-CDC6 family AAA ATPase n=1 Tax=Cognatilysobacter terrigena TaxID=2488749 RepID=UPI00105BFD97|nr:hypothetical protein [Lysobacter terrigena]
MTIAANPFTDLYTTESISAQRFVDVFSPVLLREPDVLALYQPGNVILSGLQGSGKSALLNLLKPEVLIAYKRSGAEWPLPPGCAKFLSGGINLAKSGAMDFGQRSIDAGTAGHSMRLALHFADFLNAWIVDDIFRSLETIAAASDCDVAAFLGVQFDQGRLDQFATAFSANKCWLGGVAPQRTFSGLRACIEQRIVDYRNFLNFNSASLPESILQSKTSAGEPISVAVELLREFGIIPDDLPVLIRIDQFEDLIGLEQSADHGMRLEYRATIFKMFGSRDSRLSYRVGARPYAIADSFQMLGSTTSIEELRNYTVVEIDQILERREHRTGLFPSFAEDVFKRRLRVGGYTFPSTREDLTSYVFGKRPEPRLRARQYAKGSAHAAPLAGIPDDVSRFLAEVAADDPLSAKFGEAFVRQLLARGKAIDLNKLHGRPWEADGKKWWRKERTEQALLQIAAERRQRMIWHGRPDILSLSGANILVFLSICQLIWAEYLRSEAAPSTDVPAIRNGVAQDLGIQQASEYWYRKLRADSNGGDDRQRFVSAVAFDLRRRMREDKRMSYPGANGFSLPVEVLNENPSLKRFLDRCCSFGALTSSRHTSKNTGQGESKKWYIFPIHCPHFQLPSQHTKEPLYADISIVGEWLRKAGVELEGFTAPRVLEADASTPDRAQLSLFGQATRD